MKNTPINWTTEILDFIKKSYKKWDDNEISNQLYERFGVFIEPRNIAAKRREMGLRKPTTRKKNPHKTKPIKLEGSYITDVIKVEGYKTPITWRGLQIQNFYVVATNTEEFPYIEYATKLELAVRLLKCRIEDKLKNSANYVSQQVVSEIRNLYLGGMTRRQLAVKFHIKLNQITAIIRNRIFKDKTYRAPPLRNEEKLPNKAILITIGKETHTISEWAADPRCEVSYNTIYWRYRKGIGGLDLIVKRRRAP